MNYPTVVMKEFYEKTKTLAKGDLILDVRTPEEFKEGHVPGSKNIPYDLVGQHLDELKNYQTIYVYCKRGGRARTAVEVLSAMGIKNLVCVVNSGMPEWVDAGFPIEK